MVGGTSGAMDGTPAVSAAPPAISANSTPGAETGGTSGEPTQDPAFAAEELAERVARRVLRTLAVEGERRGLRPWL
jgi:hypothetical protein